MKHLLLRSLLLFFVALFSALSIIAQENYGVRSQSKAYQVKSVAQVTSMQDAFSKRRKPKEKFEGHFKPNKKHNPLAPPIKTDLARPVGVTATQTVHSNFLATTITEGLGFTPPDCAGDLSTANQLMIAVNGRLKVYDVPTVTASALTTTQVSSNTPLASPVINVDLDAFFSNTTLGLTDFSDPHVRFDRLSGRWFVCIIDVTSASQNYIAIAVSNGTVINNSSNFTFYYLQSATGSSATDDFFDYPTLGVDKNALYIGGNMFNDAGDTYRGSPIYVVNKSSLLTGGPAAFSAFQYGIEAGKSGSSDSTGIYTPQGVHNDDPAAAEGYFVGVDVAFFDQLVVKRITNPGGTPSLSSDIVVAVPSTQYPKMQPASGSAGGLDAADDRLFAAMMMKNRITGTTSLWTAHNIQVSPTGTASDSVNSRNGSRWYEIRDMNTTPELFQAGTLFDNAATNPRGFWMPSIAMSGQGHAVMASSVAAVNRRVQVAVAGRYSGDANGILQPYDSVTRTTSAYSTSVLNDRWGDFSQTIVDPSDNMTMWTFQEYCNSSNRWGLRAVQLKAPPPASAPVITAPANNFCGSDISVTITGTTTSNEGFFDPGADAGGPGYNRLTVTSTGGILVSNVTFVSPSVVTCKMNTAGIAAGTYTLTITNPDGQFVTGNFVVTTNCVVPLTLIDFNGTYSNDKVTLDWKTADELNTKSFEVEKSFDGASFNYFTTIAAKGNTGTQNSYGLNDEKPYPDYSYYRLKMIDNDGVFKYSPIVKVKTPQRSLAITRIFPNPTNNNLTIEIVSDKKQAVRLEVYDIAGRRTAEFNLQTEKGFNTKQISLSRMSSGNYYIQAIDAGGKIIEKTKIIKNQPQP